MAVGAGLFWAGTIAWNSQALHLENVRVVGSDRSRISDAEIILAGGLIKGRHLLKISTGKAEQRIEKIPWVARASIRRVLPSTVEVSITNRVPALVLVFAGQSFLADAGGAVIAPGEARLPRITDLPGATPAPGTRITDPAFGHCRRILDALQAPVKSRLTSVRAPSIDRITLVLEDGTEILYGAAEKLDDKNFAIRTLLGKHHAAGQTIAALDVRVPTRAAVRLRQP
ncbi:MAG: cell division protein FtsQ/DivIB [Actinomycetota bacterium]